MRVLVIDDLEDAANSLKDLLELAGHEVDIATSGPTGLAKALAAPPDAVLCDIVLPGMDGYEVARAFRADPTLKGARLVAMSGAVAGRARQQALDAGFDAYLPKPGEVETLLEALSGASAPLSGS